MTVKFRRSIICWRGEEEAKSWGWSSWCNKYGCSCGKSWFLPLFGSIGNFVSTIIRAASKQRVCRKLTSTSKLCRFCSSCWDSSVSGFSISGLAGGSVALPSYYSTIVSTLYAKNENQPLFEAYLFGNSHQGGPVQAWQDVKHKLGIKVSFLSDKRQVSVFEWERVGGLWALAHGALDKIRRNELHGYRLLLVNVC